MSQRRREEIKQKKRSRWLRWGIVTAAILILAGVFVYYKFLQKTNPENFIPENPITFLLIDINPDSQQNTALEKLATNLGDEEIFKNFIEGQFFRGLSKDNLKIEEEELKSWLGDRLVISKIKLGSQESRSAHIIDVKNIGKIKELLGIVNESARKHGSVVSAEEFRGTEIVSLAGNEGIAYALYDNFLLVSEDATGVKTMVDTVLGRNKSLANDKVYRRIKRGLRGDKFITFAFVDLVESLKLLAGYSNQLDLSFLDRVASGSRFNMGAVFTAENNGVAVKTLLGGDNESNERKKGFEPNLASAIPAGVTAYIEGQEFPALVERLLAGQGEGLSKEDIEAKAEMVKRGIALQYDLDLDEDLFTMLSGQYGFVLFPFKETKGISAGLVLDINKDKNAVEKMKKIEDLVEKEINDKLIKEDDQDINFVDRDYKDKKYRFAKLPDEIKLDIYYAVLPDKIVIATGKTALTKLIDSASGSTEEVLAEDNNFRTTYQEINSKDANRLIYVDLPQAFEWLDKFEYYQYTSLDDKYRHLQGVGFLSQRSRKGGGSDGYLSVEGK